MHKNPKLRVCYSRKGFPPPVSAKNLILIHLIFLIVFLHGCAFFSPRQKFQLLLTGNDIENTIQNVKQQEEIVSQFYSTGTVSVNGWILDSSADIFIAGKRDPLMFKMEISHSWGKPLFYFLITGDRLEIRDFIEKKQYTGKFTPENLSRFLPNMDFSSDMIWSFLRGYPYFFPYARAYEGAPGVLYFEDPQKNRMGTLTLSPDKEIKEASSTPSRFPDMKFTDFRKTGDIDYAEKTIVEDIKGKKDLTLKRKKAVFDRDIPDAIFTLKNQPYFETVNLDDM